MNTASQYCRTPRRVTKAELLNAAHQALMQFNAITEHEDLRFVDNRAAIQALNKVLARAGHIGFIK